MCWPSSPTLPTPWPCLLYPEEGPWTPDCRETVTPRCWLPGQGGARGRQSPGKEQADPAGREPTWAGVMTWALEVRSPGVPTEMVPLCPCSARCILHPQTAASSQTSEICPSIRMRKQSGELCLVSFFFLSLGGWLGELFLISSCPQGSCTWGLWDVDSSFSCRGGRAELMAALGGHAGRLTS